MLHNRLGSCSLVTIATSKSRTKGPLDLGNTGIPLPHALCWKSASSPCRCSWWESKSLGQLLSLTNVATGKEAGRLSMLKKNNKKTWFALFWLATSFTKKNKGDYLPTGPLPLPLPLRLRSAPLPATPALPPSKPFSWPRTWVMKRERTASDLDTMVHTNTKDN